MNATDFKASLALSTPPANISLHLTALWYDANDNWYLSHKIIQDLPDKNAAWIHAYLHRKEGDTWNADYWYAKAGKHRPNTTFTEEWSTIVDTIISSF